MSTIKIDPDKCNKDGLCQTICPMGILVATKENTVPQVAQGMFNWCIKCGHCLAVCPTDAITHPQVCVDTQDKILTYELPGTDQVEKLMKTRRSVRRFKSKSPDNRQLERIITMADHAPSGHNAQPVKWIVFTNREEIEKLAGLCIESMRETLKLDIPKGMAATYSTIITAWNNKKDFIFHHSPCLIIGHCKKRIGTEGTDTAIAMTYMELAAHSMGLGCCWAGLFMNIGQNCQPIKDMLNLPEGHLLYGTMMVGIPKYTYRSIPTRNPVKIDWR